MHRPALTNVNFSTPFTTAIGYNYADLNTPAFRVRTLPVEPEQRVTKIQLRSNLSWSLDRLAGFFLVMSTVTLLVALLPTLMGYWSIMIAAILHVAIVGWCFRLAWRGNWARQSERMEAGKLIQQALAPHSAWYEQRKAKTASSG